MPEAEGVASPIELVRGSGGWAPGVCCMSLGRLLASLLAGCIVSLLQSTKQVGRNERC